MRLNKHLALFVLFRLSTCFFIRTYFVPDEYWQSLEVAFRHVFGYGYVTWEWRKNIRSYLYPSIFSVLYEVLDFLGLSRSYFFMTMAPKFLQSIMTGLGDYGIYSAAKSAFGPRAGKWAATLQLTSWMVFYMGPRTLTNTAEMALLGMGLRYFPWREQEKLSAGYMVFAALSFCVRPTSAILWIPFLMYHFTRSHRKADIFGTAVFLGFLIIGASTALDVWMSGKVVFTWWRFLEMNLVERVGDFYGRHPWYWYVLVGLPTGLSLHLLPFLFCLLQTFKKSHLPGEKWPVLFSIIAYVLFHSVVAHKEHRFMAPIFPLINMLGGLWLAESLDRRRPKSDEPKNSRSVWIVTGLVLTNVPIALFCGMMHQSAPMDVMKFLHDDLGDGPKLQNSGILFLTPCHSTPYYSHLLRNVPMQFLTCEPTWGPKKDPEHDFDEADKFFSDPVTFVEHYPIEKFSHIVIFDPAFDKIGKKFFLDKGFSVCAKYFNSFFPEGNRGRDLYVLCKS